ncbi:VOC family protein [Amaricoccus tamworthensis]|uniref:VOC family protein n=1 Tax=Amaricoccus tamworthensis TaxID=57002 RepID=UPI003C7ABB82
MVTVRRIVANIATDSVDEVRGFYARLFDLDTVMDHGWIATLASSEAAPAQISFASEGGSGSPVPDLSIEVDDVDAVYQRAKGMGVTVEYQPTDEPWGVRRFYLRDPAGRLVNVLSHPKGLSG